MLKATFDFHHIPDRETFYRQFAEKCHPGAAFGNNLDALWDSLTGSMALPASIHLRHLPTQRQRMQFDDIIATLKEAEAELDGQLHIRLD